MRRRDQGFSFYDEGSFERLLTAASGIDPMCKLVVLLGGEAGLRGGQIVALRLRTATCDAVSFASRGGRCS